jgi:hypothetical protein
MKHLNGIRDLIPFLDYLRDRKVSFDLSHDRHDSVMVTVMIVRERLEIDFFDDHIEYSRFTGDESVLSDQAVLFGLIEDFVRE